MTSPQFLIVRIQSIIGGHAEVSEMQMRSVAMEYYKLCQQAEAQLEHCVALIKAGRDYPALQVAESSNLLDLLNILMFPELEQWRNFCTAEKLPSPPPFDYSQIELVNSIYTKGVSQNHPLYRDYRRAMRLRKYEDALAIIKTISKINAYDAEARRECDKLRNRVITKKLALLELALKDKDDSLIGKIIEELESDSALISDNYIWKDAIDYQRSKENENNLKRCLQIIEELNNLDIENEFSKASDLVTEFYLITNKGEISTSDLDFIEKLSREIADKQDKIIEAEKSARARNLIKVELENPDPQEKISAKIKRLLALRKEAEISLDEETAKRLSSFIAKLKFKKRISMLFKLAMATSCIAITAVIAFFVWENTERQKRMSKADSTLAEIEQTQETSTISDKLANFKKQYPDLADSIFASRISVLSDNAKFAQAQLTRFKKTIANIENTDFKTAPSVAFDRTSESIERLFADINSLSPIEQTVYREKLETASKNLRDAIDERKIKNAKQTRLLLEKFENIAEEYESFARAKADIDKDAEKIAESLRPLIEDTSVIFKAHRLDIDKFNDLSVRIADAKNKYAKFDKLRDLLAQTRSTADFIASLDIIEESGATPADFARKLSRISKVKDAIKLGQLVEFGSQKAIEELDSAGMTTKISLPENKLITELFKYSREGKFDVYTIGKMSEKEHKWQGGSEKVQEVNEVVAGGKIITKTYRKHTISGRSPRGELLVGGAEAPESILGKAVYNNSAENSAISALTMIGNAKVNPIFKARLEYIIFESIKENSCATLLEYSPLAKARMEKVERYAKQLFDHSWIFESNSKEKLINSELYSAVAPDYDKDARIHLNAIKIAKENPLMLVGVCSEDGTPSLFKDPNGTLWGVNNSNGKFEKLGKNMNECAGKFAPLSPVFTEVKATQQIFDEAKKSLNK